MMVELWTRNSEMGDEDENNVGDTRDHETSAVQHAGLRWEDLVSVKLHAG